MKLALSALALLGLAVSFAPPAYAGNCDHSWQNDKAGHSCGDRASDRRQGGK